MTLQVRKCCEDMPHYMFKVAGPDSDKRIDFELDEYDCLLDDVKYCMYCGNRLQLERTPDTPAPEPYKPDLSSLSAKDRALEELKEEMK
jgi:hypothetical protein